MIYAYSIDDGASFLSNDMSLRSEQEALDAAARYVREKGAGKGRKQVLIGEVECADAWIAREMPRMLADMVARMQEEMVEDGYPCDMSGDVVRLTDEQTMELQEMIAHYLNTHGKYEGFSVSGVQEYFVEIRA